MTDKLAVLAGFGGGMWLMYVLAMRSTPHRGWLRVAERLCAGAGVCLLCALALRPLGISIVQSPLAVLSAGYLGLPGAALAAFLTLWP